MPIFRTGLALGEDCIRLFAMAKAEKTRFAEVVFSNSGDCEQSSVSKDSPRPVVDREQLATCVLNPDHCDNETGRPTHQLVKKAFGSGLSVSRLDIASGDEVTNLCKKIASNRKSKSGKQQTTSNGWLSAEAGKVRALKDEDGRLFKIYDTALVDCKAHADIVAMRYFGTSEDERLKSEVAAMQLLDAFLETSGTLDCGFDESEPKSAVG